MSEEELKLAALWCWAYLTPEEAEGETAALAGGNDKEADTVDTR